MLTPENAPSRDLVRAYILTFGNGEAAKMVLEDLDLFIRANLAGKTKDRMDRIDPLALAVAEGARRVMERIRSMQDMEKNPQWQAIEQQRQKKPASR